MSEKRIVIDRDGCVYAGTNSPLTRRGWVDKYRPKSSRAPWRGIKEGGRTQLGFRTRKEAVEWLVQA